MKIGVIGSGAWATALAHVFATNGHQVILYSRDSSSFDNEKHINIKYFPNIVLNPLIEFSTSLEYCLKDAKMILFCLPSTCYRDYAKRINSYLNHPVMILSAAKGFDPVSLEPLSYVLKEELNPKYVRGIVSLIGPSFASEVIMNKVTTISAVSASFACSKEVQDCFSNQFFRIYTNDDEIGSQCAAALKNVIAIAGGTLYGLGEGENAKAGLVTRGIKEMIRFGVSMGGKEATFTGLTGVGDLLLTCSSMQSRNYSLGYEIGKADDAYSVLNHNKKTCEGVATCKYAYSLAMKKNIDMPIVQSVYRVLYLYERPSICLREVMLRKLKSEF